MKGCFLFLPSEQFIPVKPGSHSHVYELNPTRTQCPFSQGFGSHLFMSIILTIAYNIVNWTKCSVTCVLKATV